MEIIDLLSKYSVDCVATAIFGALVILAIKKSYALPEKANRLLPFFVAFLVYAVSALFGLIEMDSVINKSMTAGGLSTVLYAFLGGYSLTKEEELKKLMNTILKSVLAENQISKVTDEIISGLMSESDEELITIKISELIKSHSTNETSEEKIYAITTIFINAYRSLSLKTKE